MCFCFREWQKPGTPKLYNSSATRSVPVFPVFSNTRVKVQKSIIQTSAGYTYVQNRSQTKHNFGRSVMGILTGLLLLVLGLRNSKHIELQTIAIEIRPVRPIDPGRAAMNDIYFVGCYYILENC